MSIGAGILISSPPSSGGGGSTGTASILLSSTQINLNDGTAAKQTLYTCPASKKACITYIVMHDASGAGGTAALSIGWNASANNIAEIDFGVNGFSTTSVQNFAIPDAQTGTQYMLPVGTVGTAGQILGAKNTTPEGSATTAILDVFGYLTNTSGVPQANISIP